MKVKMKVIHVEIAIGPTLLPEFFIIYTVISKDTILPVEEQSISIAGVNNTIAAEEAEKFAPALPLSGAAVSDDKPFIVIKR